MWTTNYHFSNFHLVSRGNYTTCWSVPSLQLDKSILPHVCSVKNHRENQTVLRAINILISSLTWKSLLYRLLVINSSALIGYIFVFSTKCHSHKWSAVIHSTFATYFLDKILFLVSFTWRRLTTERYKWLDSSRVGVCGYRQYSVQCIHSNVLMLTPINTSRTRYWNVRVEMIWPSLHLQSTVEYLNAEDEKTRCKGKQLSNTRFKKSCYRFQDCNDPL